MSARVLLPALCISAALLIAVALWILFRQRRITPEKRERRRRLHLHQYGRIGDALITEVTDSLVHYTYSVQGVDYSASQDIRALRDILPAELNRLIGVASLKYSPKNPGNSMLICEEWSGFRKVAPAATEIRDSIKIA